ncbi:polysaccharide deacetylase family protein [Anaeroselena agilis]|uniref:Polysaccharide deacetylase family protein n=1 Tax=Anaeroselena agilis TaxID=3063788 RepID=A0ABU3NVI5_9FIRM|nr:polysaccharide deacetylase family protein [Selenomonadales bacterium 4137-cl]
MVIYVAVVALAGVFWLGGCAASGGKPAAPAGGQTAKPAAAEQNRKMPPPAGVPVLMYHKIGGEKGNDAVISEALFISHMEFLHNNGYKTLSLAELEAYLDGRAELPPKPVVITFDDGYRDTYEIALPVLKKYGLKSTLFIPVADADRRLSWAELREMKAAGMEIGSHNYSHRELAAMTPARQAEEIGRSKEVLDRNLGQDSRYFCYPNGSYDAETLRLLKAKGFRLAVTIEPGWVKRGDTPLLLKRVWMGNGVDLKQFETRLTREDYPII